MYCVHQSCCGCIFVKSQEIISNFKSNLNYKRYIYNYVQHNHSDSFDIVL